MPKYGTSEHDAFTSTGRMKIIGETDEVCTTCDGAAIGPTKFSVIRETPTVVDLICTNCGTQKTVSVKDVQRKLTPEQRDRYAHAFGREEPATPAPMPTLAVVTKKPAKRKPVQKKPAKPTRPTKKTVKKTAKAGKKRKAQKK